ncbi:MFS transporter [Pelagicoccus mobilis]|uniref:MFS transporter n=1 Tax=Pelagicoccus mobilis TaxID=415221 RepID=A0A934S301_9BACT|nr:MFS transporter [Pelagicoccus mobilis]MBK1880154.1 MFS transporter [Pelagicoccus mobilis]
MSQVTPGAREPKPTAEESEQVPEKDRVPFKQKLAYAFGLSADHYAQFGISNLALPFFNILLGISPSVVTTALAISRAWDAITDPIVGSISDNLKNPKGRRKPLLFWGAILTGCFFPVVWLVPEGWGEDAVFIYLIIAFPLFYTFYSLMSVPYESLGMELTPNYRERTSVYTIRNYMNTIATLAIPFLFFFGNLSVFSDPVTGVRVVSLAVGAIIIVAGVTCARVCEERYHSVAAKQRQENLFKTARSLFKNKPLVIVVSSIAIVLFGLTSVQALDPYVHIYYIYGGDKAAGAFLDGINRTVPLVFGLLGTFCVQKLSKKYDKHHLLLASVAILFVAKLGLYVTYFPGQILLTLATKPFFAFASSCFWILIISMRADVADWDELCFGRRREGVIAALNNWLVKVSITLAVACSGYLLEFMAGFDVAEGEQSVETLESIKTMYVALPCVALGLAFVILLKYPLSRKKMEEVRAELEQRREAV